MKIRKDSVMSTLTFGQRLTALRTAKGITQQELAEGLAVSNKTISKWENDASSPDLPMLVSLARYFNVSTDALLGVDSPEPRDASTLVSKFLQKNSRKQAVQKAFSLNCALISQGYPRLCAPKSEQETPAFIQKSFRGLIASDDYFQCTVSSQSLNVSVQLLPNESGFCWLNDPDAKERIGRLFAFLAKEDALPLLYFLHQPACSESFTADYLSKNTGISQSRAALLMDELCALDCCQGRIAHLENQTVKVYRFAGDGLLLSILALAYERSCNESYYNYNLNSGIKMTGGDNQ